MSTIKALKDLLTALADIEDTAAKTSNDDDAYWVAGNITADVMTAAREAIADPRVWLVIDEGPHMDTDIYVYVSEGLARQHTYDYVRRNWGKVMRNEPMPEDPEEAFQDYLIAIENTGQSITIQPYGLITEPPKPATRKYTVSYTFDATDDQEASNIAARGFHIDIEPQYSWNLLEPKETK